MIKGLEGILKFLKFFIEVINPILFMPIFDLLLVLYRCENI